MPRRPPRGTAVARAARVGRGGALASSSAAQSASTGRRCRSAGSPAPPRRARRWRSRSRSDSQLWGALDVQEEAVGGVRGGRRAAARGGGGGDRLGRERRRAVRAARARLPSTAEALASALESKDAHTAEHARRSSATPRPWARGSGCPSDELRDLRYAAAFHDIGKVAVPERTSTSPGRSRSRRRRRSSGTRGGAPRSSPRSTSSRACSRSCATATSTGTAVATPTGSPATGSRWRAGDPRLRRPRRHDRRPALPPRASPGCRLRGDPVGRRPPVRLEGHLGVPRCRRKPVRPACRVPAPWT